MQCLESLLLGSNGKDKLKSELYKFYNLLLRISVNFVFAQGEKFK